MNLLSKNYAEEIITLAIFVICFALAIFFPAEGNLQQFSSAFFFLFLLPYLYIRFILKKKLAWFGFNLENKKEGLLWGGAMLLVSFLVIFILIRFFDLQNQYPLPAYLASNFWIFLFYELVLVNIIFFLQEFFFKGFFLFSITHRFGFLSFIIQALAFILFLSVRSLDWSSATFAILAFTGGIVAYKSKSFIYAYIMGLIFLITFDAYILYTFK